MHTIKITPNLLFEYQCTSVQVYSVQGKFIRLPNRIETFYCPNWNALVQKPSNYFKILSNLLYFSGMTVSRQNENI